MFGSILEEAKEARNVKEFQMEVIHEVLNFQAMTVGYETSFDFDEYGIRILITPSKLALKEMELEEKKNKEFEELEKIAEEAWKIGS